ncbi:MAG: arsenic resistance protein [Methylorubrum extorquens]|jgi:ACR3 family arsenite transporter|uniref:ArsB-like efflux protein n=2 Tax=Methylorubrum extorquens TaxID=408 RepID=C7CF21_METED|nr:arsenic resistance protein [Methylorubrum extorquens]EHP92755.1 Bile acid:sodium symporter [Methylorubrum extorquens DSM 13060]CAX22913.1 putative ArsB-like efflux protein [Methylorubrum extorquens DM4]
MTTLRDTLEGQQVKIYFAAIGAAVVVALTVPGTTVLEAGINPVLAFMLFVTFLQVPLPELGRAFTRVRFLASLLVTNFVVLPVLVAGLIQFLPINPMLRLGVLMVLLTPCIDYVVTFAHLGRADAKVLLASTPALLVAQMALLPVYLTVFLGEDAATFVQVGPFVHAFVWLIAVPLALAAVVQFWGGRSQTGRSVAAGLGLLPVPATALVLFVVIVAVLPQLGPALNEALRVVPVYIAFAITAPLIGWAVGRMFGMDAPTSRTLAFSAATRNSLVVLPLAFAVPGAVPLLPAVIVTQTLVELVSELVYVRLVPKLGTSTDAPMHAV